MLMLGTGTTAVTWSRPARNDVTKLSREVGCLTPGIRAILGAAQLGHPLSLSVNGERRLMDRLEVVDGKNMVVLQPDADGVILKVPFAEAVNMSPRPESPVP